MGFAARRKIKLAFAEGHDLHGLEITLKTVTLGEFKEVTERDDKLDYGRAEIEALVKNVVEWNLEDEDGNPLPVTVESFLTLDPAWSSEIREVWFRKSLGQEVPAPLDEGSTTGSATDHTPERMGLIPMESL